MGITTESLYLLEVFLLFLAHALSWFVLVHALLYKRDPRAALGWIAAAFFLPGIGALLYFSIGISRANSRAAALMRRAVESAGEHRRRLSEGRAHPPPHLALSRENLPARFHMACVGQKVTGRTLVGGNRLTPLFNGEEAYPAMLAAINEAKEEVFLSTYIFNRGVTADSFIRALLAAAERGADVRMLVDGFGSLYSLKPPWRRLKTRGIRVERFLPPRFPLRLSVNLRNHRKILVCDAKSAFTGGMNISDDHLASLPAPGRVRDVHFLCEGPVVENLRDAFLLDWGFVTEHYEESEVRVPDVRGDSLCRVILEGPGTSTDQLHDILCSVISGAKRRVRLMTPYFLPTHEIIGSLRGAAMRGVQVHVALPATNNLIYIHWAARHLLPQLLRAGVRVRYQPGSFVHTKLLLVDEAYAQFGSANIDPRSLRLNFEMNVEVFDVAFVRKMRAFFDKCFQAGAEAREDDLARAPLPLRLRDAVFWLFSPYL
jgi:cardiolipin synthase